MLYVDKKNCRGCGSCIYAVPEGTIVMDGSTARVVNKKCTKEFDCIEACPFGFIKKKAE